MTDRNKIGEEIWQDLKNRSRTPWTWRFGKTLSTQSCVKIAI